MRVFVTGATGWIGSASVDALLEAGHQVDGLARSDASFEALTAKGATPVRGTLDDLDVLGSAALDADAVLHLANKHDWADPAESNRAERAAVETFGEALAGSGKPFLVASGLAALTDGAPAAETDPSPFSGPESPRGGTENLALDFVERGIGSVILRFSPTVHGFHDHGFVSFLTQAARTNGVSGYVGEGANGWAAVHRSDAARLIALGLEKASPGAILHAVAETSVSTRAIAEAVGRSLDLPVTAIGPDAAADHFGFIARFFGMDMTGTSAATRELLGWEPTGPTLVEDITAGAYTG